jgi:hypothetical protein
MVLILLLEKWATLGSVAIFGGIGKMNVHAEKT